MEVVNTTNTIDPTYMYNSLNQFIMNPIVSITLVLMIVIYVIFASSSSGTGSIDTLGTSTPSSGSIGGVFGGIIVFILALFVIVNAIQYFFSINLVAYVTDLFSPITKVDSVVDQKPSDLHGNAMPAPAPVPEIRLRKQVFNVPGNYYTYENAKAMCSAYGAELATYDQLEKAYNNGAEWCNYGWSANQLALFPTQRNTYAKLQTIKGHENDCGRPGINGGYIANPNVKFGVNCYGYKPRMTSEEEDLMKKTSPYPETQEDIEFQQKVDKMRTKLDDVLVSPFNHTRWGEIL